MGILEKIADIEKEIARTQKNKGTTKRYNSINRLIFFIF
jgi:ribosome-interacting GTPase 1